MSRAVHPAVNRLPCNFFGRVPVVRRSAAARPRAAESGDLGQVLRETNMERRLVDCFTTFISGAPPASRRVLALRGNVIEEASHYHVFAVCAGDSGQTIVDMQRAQSEGGSSIVDEIVNAALERRHTDHGAA